MNFDELIARKAELNKQFAEIREQYQENAENIILSALRPIFDEFPNLESVNWQQYTPYFNDGDACYFSSRHYEPGVNGDRYWEVDEDNEEAYKAMNAAAEVLSAFSSDDMEDMFGDHQEITVYRDRVVVDGYTNHD